MKSCREYRVLRNRSPFKYGPICSTTGCHDWMLLSAYLFFSFWPKSDWWLLILAILIAVGTGTIKENHASISDQLPPAYLSNCDQCWKQPAVINYDYFRFPSYCVSIFCISIGRFLLQSDDVWDYIKRCVWLPKHVFDERYIQDDLHCCFLPHPWH